MRTATISAFRVESFVTGYDASSERAVLIFQLKGAAGPVAFSIGLDDAEQISAALSEIVEQKSSWPNRLS